MIEKLDAEQTEKKLKDGEFYEYELNISDSRIKYLDKIIEENPKMSAKKIDIINQLKSLYTIRKNYLKIKIYNPESKPPDLKSLDDQIRDLEKEFRDQKGRGVFTSQKELTFLAQLLTNNTAEPTARSSRKLISDIEQLINNLYENKQITKQVYNMLNKSITYK